MKLVLLLFYALCTDYLIQACTMTVDGQEVLCCEATGSCESPTCDVFGSLVELALCSVDDCSHYSCDLAHPECDPTKSYCFYSASCEKADACGAVFCLADGSTGTQRVCGTLTQVEQRDDVEKWPKDQTLAPQDSITLGSDDCSPPDENPEDAFVSTEMVGSTDSGLIDHYFPHCLTHLRPKPRVVYMEFMWHSNRPGLACIVHLDNGLKYIFGSGFKFNRVAWIHFAHNERINHLHVHTGVYKKIEFISQICFETNKQHLCFGNNNWNKFLHTLGVFGGILGGIRGGFSHFLGLHCIKFFFLK